jgi:tRNA pseudouridine38-40 synthase
MKQFFYKMVVEYDGTEFSGWQIQPGKRTVQGELQNFIEIYTRQEIKLLGSGRTDSGVHALGQVCSFSTNTDFPPEELIYRLNQMLPRDIGIRQLSRTNPGFDPRRRATMRNYRYYISESPRPLARFYSYRINRELDIRRLNRVAKLYLGKHDFALFCKAVSRKDNNECIIFKSRWYRYGGLLIYEVTADRYLHHMVRRMVGLMLAYEKAKINLTQIETFLNNRTKEEVRFSVPACGLVLNEVTFGRVKK